MINYTGRAIPYIFFRSKIAKKIKEIGIEAQLLSNMMMMTEFSKDIGVYYYPVSLMSAETGLSIQKTKKALHCLCAIGFCDYDYEAEYVWVKQMVNYVTHCYCADEKIKCHHTRCIVDAYESLPDLCFLEELYASSSAFLREAGARENSNRKYPVLNVKKGSKPRGRPKKVNADVEAWDVKVETWGEAEERVSKERISKISGKEKVMEVFEYWRHKMRGGNFAKLDNKRMKKIKDALADYSIDDIKDAIDGCSMDDFHMGKSPNSEKRFDELTLILRDSAHIEKFIALKREPEKYQKQEHKFEVVF